MSESYKETRQIAEDAKKGIIFDLWNPDEMRAPVNQVVDCIQVETAKGAIDIFPVFNVIRARAEILAAKDETHGRLAKLILFLPHTRVTAVGAADTIKSAREALRETRLRRLCVEWFQALIIEEEDPEQEEEPEAGERQDRDGLGWSLAHSDAHMRSPEKQRVDLIEFECSEGVIDLFPSGSMQRANCQVIGKLDERHGWPLAQLAIAFPGFIVTVIGKVDRIKAARQALAETRLRQLCRGWNWIHDLAVEKVQPQAEEKEETETPEEKAARQAAADASIDESSKVA